jgi:hypothetical protein
MDLTKKLLIAITVAVYIIVAFLVISFVAGIIVYRNIMAEDEDDGEFSMPTLNAVGVGEDVTVADTA